MSQHNSSDDSQSPTFEFEIKAKLSGGKLGAWPMSVLAKLLLPLSASILLGGSSFPPPASQPPEVSPPSLPTQVEHLQGDNNL